MLTITLPLPPKPLCPNARPHHMAKANAKRAYRLEAAESAQVAMLEQQPDWEPLTEATCQIIYYHKTLAFKDRDNIIASLKAAIDGLSDAGVLTDDRDLHYSSPIRRKDKDRPRVELVITKGKP